MRITVDLPPAVHRRVLALARSRQQSLSATVADLTVRGLAAIGEPVEVSTDAVSGLPVISIGRAVTAAEVAAVSNDE